jgi:hypothetical protein
MSSENPTANERSKGNKPVHEVRDGALKVSVWQNEGEYGPRYSVTSRRRYKDGEEWKDTQSYGEDDLLPLAELYRDAYAWIRQRKRADAQARRDREKEAEPAAA